MASPFIAQTYGIDTSFSQQVGLLPLLLVTSKGSGLVAGSGLVVPHQRLAASLPVDAQPIVDDQRAVLTTKKL